MYRNMAKHYDDIFPASRKVQFLSQIFGERRCVRLLDVGCSNGGVALGLQQKGFRVDAIDLSDAMIEEARRITASSGVSVQKMNMLEVARHFEPATFDGIYCVGNTLVHLSDGGMICDALSAFRRVLKPGGILFVQILDYEHILATRPESLPRITNDRVDFERQYRYHEMPTGLRIEFATTLTVDPLGRADSYRGSEMLYPLTFDELKKILQETGFELAGCYGNYEGERYRPGSPSLIVTAYGL